MKSIFFFTLALSLLTATSNAKEPLNVVFISIDDLNTDIGCYGHKIVKTPNLDKLAKIGRRFDKAYCQMALCGPSRASVMTGLRPNTLRFWNLKDHIRKTVKDPNKLITLGQFYQKKNYYVGRVGKIYHYSNPGSIGTNGIDDKLTWQERFNPKGIDVTRDKEITVYAETDRNRGKRRGWLGISMSWWDPISKDEEHTDGMVASRAIEMIERNKNKPFFVAAGFFNPHCPYVAPRRYFDLYPLKKIPMPDLAEAKKDLEDVPEIAITRDGGKRWPYYYGENITQEEARKCKQAYFACISFVDAQIGRIIEALEERKLMDKTLIVVWSDHGYFLGEKGLWFKRKNFERSLRAPLIIAGPGVKQPGEACMKPVELIDIYPTIVEETGFKVPKNLDGKSLTPILKNSKIEWNRPAISQVLYSDSAWGYSIRTDRWRYNEWSGGSAHELYDHKNDPNEVRNLATDPRFDNVMEKLKKQLKPFTGSMKMP